MGIDPTKTFVKKNSDLIPAGESVLAAVVAEVKGGAWRRGMRTTGALTDAIVSLKKDDGGREIPAGEAASWPEGPTFWLVLTDQQLHVWQGVMGTSKVGPGVTHYPLDRIAGIDLDKKLMISKLTVTFSDGSAVELDLAKQKVKPFMEAAEARLLRSRQG